MVKKLLLGLSLAGALWGCDSKEKANLRSEVDSLRTELQASQQMTQTLQDVGAMLDEIDANRQLLRTDVVEGTNYSDYASRLQSINKHIQETQAKIDELEKSVKLSKSSNSGYSATIKKLKIQLEERTSQIAALEQEVEKMRMENVALTSTISERDSMLNQKSELIQLKEQDIASLEQHVDEVNALARTDKADLYFAQAQALETAASRTKFAPRKKKETQREALELYRLSLSLGKQEAQQKVDELEKSLS